jgi:hypothetical protein
MTHFSFRTFVAGLLACSLVSAPLPTLAARPAPKVTVARVQEVAVRSTVRLIEAAAPSFADIGSKQFVEELFSGYPADERNYLAGKIRGFPMIYRVSATSLALDDLRQKVIIDFRDAHEGKVYIDGDAWLVKPDTSIRKSLPLWERKIDQLRNRSKSTVWLGEFIEPANAQKVSGAAKTLTALERLALRALHKMEQERKVLDAERRALQASQGAATNERLMALEKRIADVAAENQLLKEALAAKGSGLKQTILASVAVATAMLGVDLVKDRIKEWVKVVECASLSVTTPDCVNARLAMQKAEESLNTSPQLKGAEQEEILTKAAKLFTVSNVKCPVSPSDPLEATVGLKRPNADPHLMKAITKYSGAPPKPESAQLLSLSENADVAAEYNFKEGRLFEVCLTSAPAANDVNANPSKPVSPKRCVKDSSTGDDKQDFAYNLLLTQRLDHERAECGKMKSKIIEVSQPKLSPEAPSLLAPGGAKQ